jgi:GT2 family glycosyltransferase
MTQPNSPICSVCIANYNGESLLIDCLDSVLNQQCSFSFEIIVHDDASTDKSLELLDSRYPQVHVIRSRQNVGFCISNNRMVAQASGKFILLLNNDAALAPDALEVLYEESKRQANPGILTLPQYDWESGILVDRGCLLDPFYNPVPNLDASKQGVAMVIGACLWIPRTLWIQLGGFPEWFESIGEDIALCSKARLYGYMVQCTTKSMYKHRQGKSFGGNRVVENKLISTYKRRRLSETNKTIVMLTCTPQPLLTIILPFHITLLLIEGAVLTATRFDIKIWHEIYISALKSIIAQRRDIIKEREIIMKNNASTINYIKKFKLTHRKLSLLFHHGVPKII